ncbi:MAG: ATP-dependent DNA helicase, partial [Lachnospiraceae bacterium]|nr:ATP-dependent DNA helicase [Lachnospiraceae bacterium]
NERQLYRDYYDEYNKRGFDYAYLYPGMNKVLQAAGRVIRTASDKGSILLLDDRFAQRSYTSLFPREWVDVKYVNCDNIENILEKFWGK